MICDFCALPVPDDIEHTVYAKEFSYTYLSQMGVQLTPEYVENERWMACDACLALVQAKDREGLLQRCIAQFKQQEGYFDPRAETPLRAYQTAFWLNHERWIEENLK